MSPYRPFSLPPDDEYPGIEELLVKGLSDGSLEKSVRLAGDGHPHELALLDIPFASHDVHAEHHMERFGPMFAEAEDVDLARAVARNAFNFAHVVGSRAVGRTADINLAALPDLDPESTLQAARDEHYDIVMEYLSGRPVTDRLIQTFVDMDSAANDVPLVSILSAGATFLCIDLAETQNHNLKQY